MKQCSRKTEVKNKFKKKNLHQTQIWSKELKAPFTLSIHTHTFE